MNRSSLRIPAFLRSGVSLALAATMVVGAGAAETPKGSAGAAGAFSITTEPDNADVYVDGRLAGRTPANVASLAAGEHRVRIVKSGYLENARVVTLTAGEPSHLNVKLTKTTGVSNETAAGQVVSTGGGGGGGFPKWAWAAIAGGAVVGVVLALPKNKAPIPGAITGPLTVLQAANATFTAQGASDPDGDSLSYSWNFGDGGNGTGSPVTHAFTTAGAFTVTLTVSDGKKDATAPTFSTTVRNLTGTWRGTLQGIGTVLNLSQSGSAVTGTYLDNALTPVFGNGTLSNGTVDAATGRVAFTVTVPTFQPFTCSASVSTDVNTLNCVVNGSGFVNQTWTLTRG